MTAISAPIQAVLELFEGPLSDLRFGDIDASGLRALGAEVEAAASEVETQQLALNQLRQSLNEKQEQLLLQAQRALAYARVYAENDDALSAQLAAIHLPRAPKRPKAEVSAESGAATSSPNASDEAAPRKGGRKRAAAAPMRVQETPVAAESEPVAEATASDSDAEGEPATPAPQRRGKRRDANRVVTIDDAVESGA